MNLIIAVICDAVHVLGAEGKSGLHGNESDDYPSASKDENLYVDDEYPASTTDQRIEQLQQQLDEMVTVQEQMKSTIEILVKKLHYNASREAEAPSAQTDSREKYLRIRKSPTNSLGGVGDVPLDWQVSCSRTLPIRNDS